MGDQKIKKQNAVKRIERLSAIFSVVAVIPALRALHMRRLFTTIPDSIKACELPPSHALSHLANTLAAPLNVEISVGMANPHLPLCGAFINPVERYNTIGRVKKAHIVFLGNPSLSPQPDILSRAVIAHELAHIEQMNRPLYACARANKHTSLAFMITSAAFALINPVFLSMALASATLFIGFNALCKHESRHNEYLADLRGAEMIESQDDMIISLSYFERLQNNLEALEQYEGRKGGILTRIYNANVFSSHPPLDKRITMLQAQKTYHAGQDVATRSAAPSLPHN